MTDKKIIIDGVDVSKCGYFNNIDKSYCEECCSEFGCAICNDRPNCYYKQLKRKEQECEELKREIAFGNNGKLSDKIRAIVFKDLNAENSKYKQALDEIEARIQLENADDCLLDVMEIIESVKEKNND